MFEHQLLESLCDNNCPHQNLSVPGPGCTQCFGCSTRFKHQIEVQIRSKKASHMLGFCNEAHIVSYCMKVGGVCHERLLWENEHAGFQTCIKKRLCVERQRERPQAHQNAAIDPAIVTLPRNSLMLMPVTPLHPCHSLTNQWGFRWITCVWLM